MSAQAMRSMFLVLLGVGLALLVMVVAGSGDYAEAQRQETQYCENVKDGTWPDYRKVYKEMCKK